MFTLGAAAGGLSTMLLNDCLGRKLSIMFSALPSALGYALLAGAQGLWMLLLGRVLTGYAGGVTSASIPVRRQGNAGQEVLWVSWGLQGRRCCGAVDELGHPAAFRRHQQSPRAASGRVGMGRMQQVSSQGWGGCTHLAALAWPAGAEPVGAGLPRLQERQGRSSTPAPPGSYFLPNTTLVFHTEGKAGVE